MDENIDNIENEKNDMFLDILKNQSDFDSKSEQKILFITTDSWIAQLGCRKNN